MKSKSRSSSVLQPYIPSSIVKGYKIVLFGSGGVGKSSLTLQLIRKEFVEEYDPTIEDSYHKTLHIDGADAELEILDTAGQEEFISMRDQYTRNGHGFMVVYSIDNRSSFNEANSILKSIFKVKEKAFIPIVLVANKCDLASKRIISASEGQDLARCWNAAYVETSAKLGVHVTEGFEELVRSIRRIRYSSFPSQTATHRSTNSASTISDSITLNTSKREITKELPSPKKLNSVGCCNIL